MFTFRHSQKALSRDLSHNERLSPILTALLSLCHRGSPDQTGHPQGPTGGRNQLVIPSPWASLSQPFSAAASLASKHEEDQEGQKCFWTFPLTGNHLFVFKVLAGMSFPLWKFICYCVPLNSERNADRALLYIFCSVCIRAGAYA